MNKIITIQADPIEKINPKTDTTLLLALEAKRRNCKIYWYETKDVSLLNSKLIANIKAVKLFNNKKKYFKIMKRKKFDLYNSKFIYRYVKYISNTLQYVDAYQFICKLLI